MLAQCEIVVTLQQVTEFDESQIVEHWREAEDEHSSLYGVTSSVCSMDNSWV